ncbi:MULTISPECIES: SH3 domain-containing protein [Streptomyces]|uniref:SH3 domain-containing protein n=6 Tax=Streptomyces TaxID=1883 RepID=A0ABW9IAU8_STRGJ|nr:MULTISPECIES: SH3 domain-containing protein [Streptomyces]MBP5861417.1 SH3 domain-containing protein [Streptomyces sp. LBUM 1484]MBP5869650.1 SH3 domain-containing protein [Streptomyces sp. LBUM 1485]MBP5901962.1 SH3 domain-containing protein [Streptomyces sp. LBUM 1488]MBP5908061.1 SH3 domain-containing protein [Streptomyces sp. LBUM 1478]MBP5914398.1 SH3 domain-containing protein [Streptomyces sp. LBUM 1486]MBP5928958.1 SH3 domain-containing protein [Streptomyces sp. LBUM 1479]QTU51230.
MLGAIALPMLSTTPASAAPAAASTATSITPCPDLPPLPYKVHASAVTIRSKATTQSTAVGVLYKSHKFTVHKKSGNWLYTTDKSTGVKGWVSGTYVYRDTRMCLD